jgi:hypothetical protein
MPSVSRKQQRLMAAVATDPTVAKRTGVPKAVGMKYLAADRRRSRRTNPLLQKLNRPKTAHGAKSKLF